MSAVPFDPDSQLIAQSRARWPRALVLFVVAAALMHAWWLDRPFTACEPNPGKYFGPYLNALERFGFFELRGVLVAAQTAEELETAPAYFNHPPGLTWLFQVFGSQEWQMRMVTIVASVLAALALYLLLVRRLGERAALTGGTVVLLSPNFVVYSMASYECVVTAFGLIYFLAVRREGIRLPRWAATLGVVLAGVIGTWVDWTFAFFCAGCAALVLGIPIRRAARQLALPAAVSVLALALYFVWLTSVSAAGSDMSSLFGRFVGERTPILGLLQRIASWLPWCFTWPVVLATPIGLYCAIRIDPRLTLAAAIAACPLLVFSLHGDLMFYTFLLPLIGVSCAALVHSLGARSANLSRFVAIALVGSVAIESCVVNVRTDSTFLRDFSRALSEATGSDDSQFVVAHNMPTYYAFYVERPGVLPFRVVDPNLIAPAIAQSDQPFGFRYLWCRTQLESADSPLGDLLAKYPRVHQPHLEQTLDVAGDGSQFTIEEAWLYTLRLPPVD